MQKEWQRGTLLLKYSVGRAAYGIRALLVSAILASSCGGITDLHDPARNPLCPVDVPDQGTPCRASVACETL